MSFTLVEKQQGLKKSSIAIRPYFDPSRDNMGLENYGMTVFDGVVHEEPLACLEINGIKRYKTGLNEFAPEIKMLPDEEREAKIKQIRKIVVELEKVLAANIIKEDDPDFWSKVTICLPNNSQLWDKILIRCGNEPVYLDVQGDPYDLIRLMAIEDGGFSMIARSLDEARSMAKPPKFYLDKQEDTAAIVTEIKKLKAKAMAKLTQMFENQQNKLFLVAKVVDANSFQYKKSTPTDVLYDNMFEWIEGNRSERDKRKCAQRFLDATALDAESLKIRAIIKDASFLKAIHTKSDGYIYHMSSGSILGKNPTEIAEFLKNPLHEDILKQLSSEVEKQWNL